MSRKFISVALFQTILLWQVSFGFFSLGNIFGLFGLGGASAMTPGTSGGEVVKQALSKLESSNIFPDSHDMMQRIAWVESKYGNHKNTYREGYNGGIWQVDKIAFIDSQTHPIAKSKLHAKIKAAYGVDWPSLEWSELRKPMYSALAGRAKLYITGNPPLCNQAIPDNTEGQAEHWKICYNTYLGAGTIQKFIDDVAVMLELP